MAMVGVAWWRHRDGAVTVTTQADRLVDSGQRLVDKAGAGASILSTAREN
jgi:hypothetical protein